MAQLDCRNALSWRLVDGKVMARGDDLVMAIRIEGSFTEIYVSTQGRRAERAHLTGTAFRFPATHACSITR